MVRLAVTSSCLLALQATGQSEPSKPTADDFWSAMMAMFDSGPRLTGSPGHKQFLDNVEKSLSDVGFQMQRDPMQFNRWDVTNYSLVVHMEDGDVDIPVGYPFVRSGLTDEDGVTLPFGNALTISPHIAITHAPMTALGPVGCDLAAITLEPAAKAAVCCISREHVRLEGEYQPFTNPSLKPGLPTLMVADENCELIKSVSGKLKTKATLKLIGTQDPDETAHVWGVLPGQTNDTVIMGIHSDGQNAVEENGIPALVTMAKYIASLPLEKRKRSLAFVAASGHMNYDIPHPETQGFANLHKKDLMKNVKACVAPEHFGTMQWKMDGDEYKPSGKSCEYTGFGSNLKLQSQLKNAFKQTGLDNHMVLTGPFPEEAGSALGWRLAGCPTVGGISLPDYLVNLHHGGPDKLDKDRYFATASAYMQVIEDLLAADSLDFSDEPSFATSKDFSFYRGRGPYSTATVRMTDGLDKVWYPEDAPDGTKFGVYIFAVGTSTPSDSYAATLDHIASHGFVVIGVGNHKAADQTCTKESVTDVVDLLQDPSKLPSEIANLVDGSRVAMGGHSGGGPCALKAAGLRPEVVKGSISQHGAAIPGVNRLSKKEIAALPGAVMTLCGTLDVMPFCGCINAQEDYYGRFAKELPKVGIAVTGVDHVLGTEGKTGDKAEGGYVVAFLYSVLNGDAEAAQALVDGIGPRGDKYQAENWPAAATVV